MMKMMPLCAALLALAACGRPAAEKAGADAKLETPSQRVVCETTQLVGRDAAACGVGLSAQSSLTLDGAALVGADGPFLAAANPDRPAQTLIIYPSPGGLFVLIRACEGPPAAPGACARAAIIDRDTRVASDVALAPIAGAPGEIVWSLDHSRFALVDDGRLAVVDAQSQRIATRPEEDSGETWRIAPGSIRFADNATVTVRAVVCRGADCAAPAEQRVALD